MNETSRDIRYRQTEEDLRDAFELLCLKKDPQKITVAEMAERTGVTRSTFYNHYTDMPTLIMKMGAGQKERTAESWSAAFFPRSAVISERAVI